MSTVGARPGRRGAVGGSRYNASKEHAMEKIYITHCSATKDDSLAGTGRKVTADLLYTATPTRRFMARCKDRGVRWAIFSDHYGVWVSGEKREWYGVITR